VRDGSLYLLDWDTVALAPRERDLWMVLDRDSREDWLSYTSMVAAPSVNDNALRLYRLWWNLAEITEYVGRFRRPHDDSSPNRSACEDLGQYLPIRQDSGCW